MTNVANGLKLVIQPQVTNVIAYGKKLGEWTNNVTYGMNLDVWQKKAKYGINYKNDKIG